MSNIKLKDSALLGRPLSEVNGFLIKRPYLLLLIPLFFIAYPLSSPGIPITLDFPALDTSDYASGKLWVWTEKGSVPALETISRFPIIGLWYMLGFLGISSAAISKFMIIMGFFVASFSFYFSFVLLLERKITKNAARDAKLRVAAVIGAVFFAYNPWSLERIPHWYLWIGYAVLPLFFISVVYAFRYPKNWRYIASSIFLWSFASTTPHNTVFYGIIFLIVFAYFILNNLFEKIRNTRSINNVRVKGTEKKGKNAAILVLLVPFFSILLLYVLLNVYWIYPYLLASQIREVSPNYLLVQENLELLSRASSFLNVFRLVANWQEQPFEIPAEGTPFYYLWFLASVALPIFGFSALVISGKALIKYTSGFAIFALIGIILAMGTQSPINYFKYVLETPTLSNYGWLVRDPDKWGFLMAFTYSFLIGIAVYRILERIGGRRAGKLDTGDTVPQTSEKERYGNRKKILVSTVFLGLLVFSIGLHCYPTYLFNMSGELSPVVLPAEFDKLNRYLSGVDAESVYFLPYPLDETKWNKLNRVGNVYQTHSLKPSIESSGSTGMAGMGSTNYYNYLARSVVENRTRELADFIYPLGTSYLIFHNDTWDKRTGSPDIEDLELLEEIKSLEDVENVRNIGFFNVFKVLNNNNNNNNTNVDNNIREELGSEPHRISILNNNVVAVGGLHALRSLSSLESSFSSLDSSVVFVDQATYANDTDDVLHYANYLILERSPSYYDLMFSLLDSKYIIDPSKVPVNYDPTRLWSKAGAMDPDFGHFHPYLEHLGIENWQFDYRKGLVITQAVGANVSVPMEIPKTGQYDIFLRFLKNQRGGIINVYLDNRLINQVNTLEESSNFFSWQNILRSSFSPQLKEGKHTITLENVAGFNAVNILAVIPVDQASKLLEKTISMAQEIKNIYLLEAESNFYNNKGLTVNGYVNNSSSQSSAHYVQGINGQNLRSVPPFSNEGSQYFNGFKMNETLEGQIKVPENADLLSFLMLIKDQNGYPYYNASRNNTQDKILTDSGSDLIENVEVYPALDRRNIIQSDFEGHKITAPLGDLRRSYWQNHDENALSMRLDHDNPISGNASLRVDVGQGHNSEWSVISTDFIPINNKLYYNFDLNASTKDVKQFHCKVTYYDEERKRIESDFISRGQDGTFRNSYSTSIVPPLGAKYLRFEILVRPITSGQTSYLIDDMKFEETSQQLRSVQNHLDDFQKLDTSSIADYSSSSLPISSALLPGSKNNTSVFDNSSRSVEVPFTRILGNSTGTRSDIDSNYQPPDSPRDSNIATRNYNDPNASFLMQKTRPVPVIGNSIYNFSISLKRGHDIVAPGILTQGDKDVSEDPRIIVGVIPHFTNTSDVTRNLTKYGQNASGAGVLTLSPQSEIYADLDILKPANYTIALRVNACNSCSFLTVAITDKEKNNIIELETVSLKEVENDPNAIIFPTGDITNTRAGNSNNKNTNNGYVRDAYSEGELEWLYLDGSVYLDNGRYEVKIYSDPNSRIDLDSVVMYSNSDDSKDNTVSVLNGDKKRDEALNDIFSLRTDFLPAYLAEYKKINPTKYEVKIENATRPYVLSLAETYDPLWMASYDSPSRSEDSSDGNSTNDEDPKISSIPLYSIVNGFLLNKTGDYTLTIEYQPQKWFIQGAIISIITAISILLVLIISSRLRNLIQNVKSRYSNIKIRFEK